jgi:hypothetical protein
MKSIYKTYFAGWGFCLGLMIWAPACTVEGFENPEVEFFITKEWKIKELIGNDQIDSNADISRYRLNLMEDFTYTRVCIEEGTDACKAAGTWNLVADETQLVLYSEDPLLIEHYLILELKVRELQLKIINLETDIPDDNKLKGDSGNRYILEPVKN